MSTENENFTVSPLPFDLESLSAKERESTEYVVRNFGNITFWEYVNVLRHFEAEGKINTGTKKVLKELYFSNFPLCVKELYFKVVDDDPENPQVTPNGMLLATLGANAVGGFAAKMYEFFHKNGSDRKACCCQENLMKDSKSDNNNGNDEKLIYCLQFLEEIWSNEQSLYIVLRSKFRSALAVCFSDEVIRNW